MSLPRKGLNAICGRHVLTDEIWLTMLAHCEEIGARARDKARQDETLSLADLHKYFALPQAGRDDRLSTHSASP
jgi:hypothetical protein